MSAIAHESDAWAARSTLDAMLMRAFFTVLSGLPLARIVRFSTRTMAA